MNKGQVNQVFLFLIAIIIILATLYLGGRFLGIFTGTACDASDAEFMHQLGSTLDEYSTYGSRGSADIQASCDARQLCFVDSTMVGSPESISFSSPYPAMNSAVRNGVESNIFLIRDAGTLDVGYDPRIRVRPVEGYTCVNVTRGEFVFRTEGQGRHIMIG